MAVKKVVIAGGLWRYVLTPQFDGTIHAEVTKPDGTVQRLILASVEHDVAAGVLRFVLDGRRRTLQVAREHAELLVRTPGGKLVRVQEAAYRQAASLFMPATGAPAEAVGAPQPYDAKTLKSPLAGRVTKVLVALGQEVVQGQPLLMIESMKMENELCAAAAGCVQTIFIQAGDVVKPNQVLLSLA